MPAFSGQRRAGARCLGPAAAPAPGAARGLALGLVSLTIPLVPLLLLSRLIIEGIFVASLGLALFRGLLRPEVRAYLNEP